MALAGLSLAGCTEEKPGQPVGSTSAVPGGTTVSGPPTVAIPARPRDIALNDLDPCKLFAKSQLDQMKVNKQANKTQAADPWKGSPYCAMDGQDGQVFYHYTAMLATTEGIEPWLTGKRNADAKLVSIDGFPAATYTIRGVSTLNCWTSVGVANSQQLVLEFRPTNRGVFTQEQMCQKSEQAAAFAMQTLKTLK